MSQDAPTVWPRFSYGSTTIHDGSATIQPGGATNAHDASTIQHGASAVQAGSATVASRQIRGQTVALPLRNRDQSGWIWTNRGVSDTPIRNDHECNHGATTIDPDSATVELRFRPRPQSTTIHPDSF